MATTTTTFGLDHHAKVLFARTRVVYLAAGLARCWRCSALMREAVIDGTAVYRCLGSHSLEQVTVDEALWGFYLTHDGHAITTAITDARQRRGRIYRAFSAITLDPAYDTAPAGRLIKAAYPRLHHQ